jgi:cobalt/nickel transport system permease protein
VLLFSFVLSVEILSDLGVGYVLKRSALALPFILAALPLLFSAGPPLLGSLPVGPWTLELSQPGLERFLSIAVKSWLSMQVAIVLASTTPFPDLLVAMRALKVPRLLVAIFGLMWRYLFVLVDEALRLLRAREARSGLSGRAGLKAGGSIAWRARVTGGMAGNLLVRSFDRGERIHAAMAARGYDGEVRTLSHHAVPTSQWVVLAAGIALLLGVLGLASLLVG